MSPKDYEAEIAAAIRTKGITRCPTACIASTQAAGTPADRKSLWLRADRLEALRQGGSQQLGSQQFWARVIGAAA